MKLILLNLPFENGETSPIAADEFNVLQERAEKLYEHIELEYIESPLKAEYNHSFILIRLDDIKLFEERLNVWKNTIEGFDQIRKRLVLLSVGDREGQSRISKYGIAGATISPRGSHLIHGWVGNMYHSPFFMGIKEVIEQMKTGEVRSWPESLPTSEKEFHYIGAHEKEPVDPFLVLVEYLELYEKYMKEKGLL